MGSPAKRDAVVDEARTRRRLLAATLARIASGSPLPGAVAAAAVDSAIAADLAHRLFPRDEHAVLALYERLAQDLAARVPDLPTGGVGLRFVALMEAKLALVAPHRAALARLLARVLDHGGNLGALSSATATVRARVGSAFAAVVAGAADRPQRGAPELGHALYTIHLAILLLWTQDMTPDGRATRAAVAAVGEFLSLVGPGLDTAIAAHAIARAGTIAEAVTAAPPPPAVEATAQAVLDRLLRDRRLLPGSSCDAAPCARCRDMHLPLLRALVATDEPIHLVLPAFPAKSPSRGKTLGPLPDLAEELALRRLQALLDDIAAAHPPGARLTICSDGHVFADLVGVAEADVDAYGRGIGDLLARIGARGIDLFTLADAYLPEPCAALRARLVADYADTLEAIRERARSHPRHRAQFDGIHRFLVEDRAELDAGISRTQAKERCKELTAAVIQRSEAWGRLIAECFPRAVRLSIHPQDPHADKLGIGLVPSSDRWLTPWHAVAVERGGVFTLAHRREAEAMGAVPVERDGRPSHYRVERA